jgi:hypothetical protein
LGINEISLHGDNILLGRLVSVLFGAATALPVYWIGKYWWGRTAGLLAASLMSVAYLSVRNSHYATPDITGTFFITLSACFIVTLSPTASKRGFFLAGLYAGLAISTRMTALVLFIPILLYYLFSPNEMGIRNWKTHRQGLTALWKWILQQLFTKELIFTFLGICIGYILFTPPIWVMPLEFARLFWFQYQLGNLGGFGEFRIIEGSGWSFYLETLGWGLGIIFLIFSLIGLLWILVQHRKVILFLFSFPVLYYLLMGNTGHAFARYALPLIPFLALSTGGVIWQIAHWLNEKNRLPIWSVVGIGGLLWGLCLAPSIVSSIRHNYLLTQVDTRTQAKLWIESNLPEGSQIAQEWHTPELAEGTKTIPLSARSYNLWTSSVYGLSDFPIDHYCQERFDYLITSSFIRDIPMILQSAQNIKDDFYNKLDQNANLLIEFTPYKGEASPQFYFEELYGPAINLFEVIRPGPVIRIYELNCDSLTSIHMYP